MSQLAQLKEKHTKEIAQLKRKESILAQIEPLGLSPWIIYTHSEPYGIKFKDCQLSDVFRIFDTLPHTPTHVIKQDSWACQLSHIEKEGYETRASDSYAFIRTQANERGNNSATLGKFATLPDGTTIKVDIEFESAYWAKGFKHKRLFPYVSEEVIKDHGRIVGRNWHKVSAPVTDSCAYVFGWRGASESDFGQAGVYATRECLEYELQIMESE